MMARWTVAEYRITAGQRVPDNEGEDRTDLFSFVGK
jgi:hypothetical protein